MLYGEDDLENKPCMFHDCSALQAAERSFYGVLTENLDNNFTGTSSTGISTRSSAQGESSLFNHGSQSDFQSCGALKKFCNVVCGLSDSPPVMPRERLEKVVAKEGNNGRDNSPDSSRGKKNHYRDDNSYLQEGRNNKLPSYGEDSDPLDIFDKLLLCPGTKFGCHDDLTVCPFGEAIQTRKNLQQNEQPRGSKVGRPLGKKQDRRTSKVEVVDLRILLTQCAQAVSNNNSRAADELLKWIRKHSSPYGDGTERLAHYFANALQARLTGTGTTLYTAFTASRILTADILKAYQVYVASCPFKKMSNIFANKSITKLTRGVRRLHIINFGILYGFQWPCLIQGLSVRPGGPPKLSITGIDFPQPGFRPAGRVEETEHRLANYCKRFNVPFEYNAIAKKWDTIQLEDLMIDSDEMLIVSFLYWFRNVPDETLGLNCAREVVLKLIKRTNPDMFIHGVVNGTYNPPFFLTRFKEALLHFQMLFDMLKAPVPPA